MYLCAPRFKPSQMYGMFFAALSNSVNVCPYFLLTLNRKYRQILHINKARDFFFLSFVRSNFHFISMSTVCNALIVSRRLFWFLFFSLCWVENWKVIVYCAHTKNHFTRCRITVFIQFPFVYSMFFSISKLFTTNFVSVAIPSH